MDNLQKEVFALILHLLAFFQFSKTKAVVPTRL
jgi:hypothetical protein